MKIKIYEVQDNLLAYPVGNDMKAAMSYGFRMADLFKTIKAYQNREVNVWCRGSSGAILGTLFSSYIPNVTRIVHIKKEGENAHSTYPRPLDGAINVIIDDFIDTGNTLYTIYKRIQLYDKVKIHVLVIENQGKLSDKKGSEWIKEKIGFIPLYLITNQVAKNS